MVLMQGSCSFITHAGLICLKHDQDDRVLVLDLGQSLRNTSETLSVDFSKISWHGIYMEVEEGENEKEI